MKWLMGDQQPQQVPGTTPPSSTPSNPQVAPALPQPPVPPTPIVFVEAKPPVVPVPVQTTTPAPATPAPQSPALDTAVVAQPEKLPDLPSFQEEKKESTIIIDEKRELTTDLISEALNSAVEPASTALQSPFIPSPSSIITPDSTFGATVISEVKEAVSTPTMQAITEEAPAALAGMITSQLPKASLDIPPQEPIVPMVSPEEEPKNEMPITPIEPKVIPQTGMVTSQEQEGPDLPDVSADIKRILQERWITLANTELAKLEKRHSDTSTALAELEKTQQELAAKKLKLEADMLEVEQSKAGWDKKKIEAQTTLDRVVKEVSEL